jgi:hypothetical protein
MHEHGMTRYHDSESGLLVEIEKKEKFTVLLDADKSEDVKDAIDEVTPGEDDPIETKTMKRTRK